MFSTSSTNKWVMINEDSRKLQKVNDDVRDEYLIFCPKTPRLAFPKENNGSWKKIAKLEDPAEFSRLRLVLKTEEKKENKKVDTKNKENPVVIDKELLQLAKNPKVPCPDKKRIKSYNLRKPLFAGAEEGYCSSEGRHGRTPSPSPLAAVSGKHQIVVKPSSASPIKPSSSHTLAITVAHHYLAADACGVSNFFLI
ncbi:hypothetical protein L2E82_32553 [Cichorium intybus]|uniref:Uncharacterized protein n=1 Tax=Cichorium intybus TaxID=13427 RepID=A0ACB9BGA5_CICIN|nr:hypothetical protein L2E82_32553 [Cichorium intybus]